MAAQSYILVVDDERAMRDGLAECLRDAGYEATPCQDVDTALSLLGERSVDLVITDLVMEPRDGMELLSWVRENRPQTPVIMMTGHSSIESAVEAMRRGAFDYIGKPFQLDEVRITVHHALTAAGLKRENRQLRRQLEVLQPARPLIGDSAPMAEMLDLVAQIAPSDIPVLIVGETGTGKELVAREIHQRSMRSSNLFLSVNCAALPATLLESELFGHVRGAFTGAVANREGLFEAATGGTLFLDEIGDIELPAQARLLRVLQNGEIRRLGEARERFVDVRVIAATNQDLQERIRAKQFREDLYYRLNVATVATPPLRDRREDIPQLADYFLSGYRKSMGLASLSLSEGAMNVLQAHDWPGNVRELENMMKRAAVVCRTAQIEPDDLPPDITSTARAETSLDSLADMERRHIAAVLESVGGNISQAARILQITRPTLRSKIEKYDIEVHRPHDG